jgi:hypothetical protein
MHMLLVIIADNISNIGMLRRSLESTLQSQSIYWNAKAIIVNCLTHILNMSEKAICAWLKSQIYDKCMPSIEDDKVYDRPTDPLDNDNDEDSQRNIPKVQRVSATLLKVSPYPHILK